MTCETCKRETTAVTIGTSKYCALCGSRVEGTPEAAARPAVGRPRSMDLGPAVARPTVVSARGTGAQKLHQRVSGVKSMDMRGPVRQPAPAETVETSEPEAISQIHGKKTTPHLPHVQPSLDPNVPNVVTRHRPNQDAKIAERLNRAQAIPRSHHVQRFGDEPRVTPLPPAPAPAPLQLDSVATTIPAAAIAAHEALTKLVPATVDRETSYEPVKVGNYAAIIGVIVIMGGYIWFHNYSNLTIQAAAAKAGVSATTPSYLPTSYSLANTSSTPGLLTLDFKSPSESTPLQIAQQRTTWDTKSLLDNYVAKNDSDYTSVSGQGLTIYLYGQNEAAWINHGIWYSIAGTARLSREQVLKIAYGL